MFAPLSKRRCYAVIVLKKIFAALAGALALIIVPPSGEAERQLPIVLDLSSTAPPPAPAAQPLSISIALLWPLAPQ